MPIEQNKPETIAAARKKIAQLNDAAELSDLIYSEGVASGWLAALRLEKLLDIAEFSELSAELHAVSSEVRARIQSS